MFTKVIYPGTFDPITNGHLDIIIKTAKIFDQVVLAIASSHDKLPLFNLKERISLAIKVTAHISNVSVKGFTGLIIDFARQQKSSVLIRGIRTIMDIEYEIKLAKVNKQLMSEIETIFIISSDPWSYITSTILKEIVLHGGNVDRFLPFPFSQEIKLRQLNQISSNTDI